LEVGVVPHRLELNRKPYEINRLLADAMNAIGRLELAGDQMQNTDWFLYNFV
jgi:hypothetical protein